MKISSLTVVVDDTYGMPLLAAAALARTTRRFVSDIRVGLAESVVNGKSVLELLTLGVTPGAYLNVTIRGTDAAEASQAIAAMFPPRSGTTLSAATISRGHPWAPRT